MTTETCEPPDLAEREELRAAIDELMRGPVAFYQIGQLPTWASER